MRADKNQIYVYTHTHTFINTHHTRGTAPELRRLSALFIGYPQDTAGEPPFIDETENIKEPLLFLFTT